MAHLRLEKTPPPGLSHPPAPSTPRRLRPPSRNRPLKRQITNNATKSTPQDTSYIHGKLQRTDNPPVLLDDSDAIAVELMQNPSTPKRVRPTGLLTPMKHEGTAGPPTLGVRARSESRLDADAENTEEKEGITAKTLKDRLRDFHAAFGHTEQSERILATTFASAASTPHPEHLLQSHQPTFPLGTADGPRTTGAKFRLSVTPTTSAREKAATEGLTAKSLGEVTSRSIASPHSLSSGDQATPTPRRRSAIPTPLLNVKPQINASDLFDCMPELITAPMSFEQRRARIRAIMPDLKSLNDADIPLPEPYNAAYPHPISAYASPGVNPAALYISGYDKILKKLLAEDRDKLKGGILASAARDDVLPPALTMIFTPGEGNGIPERLWTRFESIGGARLPVGAATPGPYARVEPAIGHPDPFSPYIEADSIPPRFANLHAHQWQHHGQLTPPERHTRDYFEFPMTRRTSTNDINTWRNELSGTKSMPIPARGVHSTDVPLSSSTHSESHWFKTEICPIWADTGICKYGKACQYAHGSAELRALPRMAPLPTPPLDASPLTDDFFPEGTRPYTTIGHKGSLPDTAILSRLDTRRASAPPPRDLSPVGEFDEDIAPSFWRGDYVAPIGAERVATSPRKRLTGVRAANLQLAQSSDAMGTDSLGRQSLRIDTDQHRLVNFPSASSLSTSSSKLSAGTQSHETATSAGWSPVEPEPTYRVPAARAAECEDLVDPLYPAWRRSKSSTSTSLDFSTGRSIWC